MRAPAGRLERLEQVGDHRAARARGRARCSTRPLVGLDGDAVEVGGKAARRAANRLAFGRRRSCRKRLRAAHAGERFLRRRRRVNRAERGRAGGNRLAGFLDPRLQGERHAAGRWSAKRERQYEHIKEASERGEDEDTAEEIAARTVNKERARTARPRRRARRRPMTSRPGGAAACARIRPGGGPTPALRRGGKANVKGRSKMTKAELERAVGRDVDR